MHILRKQVKAGKRANQSNYASEPVKASKQPVKASKQLVKAVEPMKATS